MFSQLIVDYTDFKQKHFSEQVLRLSNTICSVFSLWNVVRVYVESGLLAEPTVAIAVVLVTTIAGMLFGILMLLKLSLAIQLLSLPLAVIALALSSERGAIASILFVLGFAILILTLVRFIIFTANKINRL